MELQTTLERGAGRGRRKAGGEDFVEIWRVQVKRAVFDFAHWVVEGWIAPEAAWSGSCGD